MAQSGTRIGALAVLVAYVGCAADPVSPPAEDDPNRITVVQGAVTATAYLRGDNIIISIESDEPIYARACVERTKLQTRGVGDDWQPLRTDAPSGFHNGYYLDDVYVTPTVRLGCDVQVCDETNGGANAGPPVEIIAAGTRPAPAWVVSSNAADPAPVFVTEPVSGLVRAELTYFTDPACTAHETVSLELDVPEEGVCCPVGPEGCSSQGPKGGWASSLETCDEWGGAADEYAQLFTDNRGCPALRNIPSWTENTDIPECMR